MDRRIGFFVHVDLGDDHPVVAGYHYVADSAQHGYFVYAKSYCENPKAFAIDPINLPLIFGRRFYFPQNREACGIPGAFLDCGPDEWGKRILNQFSDPKPVSVADYLVMGSGHGVGALSFSDSKEPAAKNAHSYPLDLNQIYGTALEFDSATSQDLGRLEHWLMPSSGIGGARPKAHVRYKNIPCIAKFNRKDDIFDNALIEFAMMSLAKKAGIFTAEVHIEQTEYGHCLLVERFDYCDDNYLKRRHILSAHSLLNVFQITQLDQVSYDRIGAVAKRISSDCVLVEEIYRRMLFNIAIGNTDDHSRNHAFLKNIDQPDYVLSPAYDLVPLPQRLGSHAINIGPFGQTPTFDNVTSSGRLMGLDMQYQQVLAGQVLIALRELEDYFASLNVSQKDIDVLKPCFSRSRIVAEIAQQELNIFC